jgi:hypothetical protein
VNGRTLGAQNPRTTAPALKSGYKRLAEVITAFIERNEQGSRAEKEHRDSGALKCEVGARRCEVVKAEMALRRSLYRPPAVSSL